MPKVAWDDVMIEILCWGWIDARSYRQGRRQNAYAVSEMKVSADFLLAQEASQRRQRQCSKQRAALLSAYQGWILG
ncbi:MAG TPA: hypothetical protein DE179_07975 [Oceanospirillaceae bacterium]|nr:hypothetical protein [Oceanospirillaceae bacterium]